MKLLTWNVFWRAMNDRIPRCQNQKCLKKINSLLPGFDIVCLQECSNWASLDLQEYAIQVYQRHKNVILTAYDPRKYHLDYSIAGKMVDDERLFMISFFNSSFAIINVHAGHHRDIHFLEDYVRAVLDKESLARLKHHDLILMGDLNDHATTITLFGRQLIGAETKPTCCYSHDGNKFIGKYTPDHILSTLPVLSTEVHDISEASDHRPITARVKTTPVNAYDFDGVIQQSVTLPDAHGERHPVYPLVESSMIKALIKKQLARGERVIIISARAQDEEIKQMVPNIPIICTNGRHKSKILFAFGVNRFYEDSPLRIADVVRNASRLPLLKQLYLVDPDRQKIVRITIE